MNVREDEIRERLEAATPGPWEAKHWRVCAWPRGIIQVIVDTALNNRSRTPENEANAQLIANAPSDLRYLLEKVDEYRVACEHWYELYSVLTAEEKADVSARLKATWTANAIPLDEAIRRLKESTA